MSSEPPAAALIVCRRMKADHELMEAEVARLIGAIEASDHAAANTQWASFEHRTRSHLDAEDDHLLPALLRWKKHVARAIVEEHKLIRRRLAELGPRVGTSKVAVKDLERFLDELRAHARTEERRVYEWADEHLAQGTKDELLAALAG